MPPCCKMTSTSRLIGFWRSQKKCAGAVTGLFFSPEHSAWNLSNVPPQDTRLKCATPPARWTVSSATGRPGLPAAPPVAAAWRPAPSGSGRKPSTEDGRVPGWTWRIRWVSPTCPAACWASSGACNHIVGCDHRHACCTKNWKESSFKFSRPV